MYVEMALLSRLNVLIGHPTLALAVLLGGIILFAGLGSLLSNRISIENRILSRVYPLVPALLVLTTGLIMESLLTGAMVYTTGARIAIAVALIAPSALGLGICFPLGLRLIERRESSRRSESGPTQENAANGSAAMGPWMWGINGALGVCASGLALGTSMVWGIQTTLWIGAVCYFLLLLPTWRLSAPTD
jgi:hypothetical protein